MTEHLFKHKPLPPITVELIEGYLDHLADLMVKYAPEFDACLPLYQRLEFELTALKNSDKSMAAVYQRAHAIKPTARSKKLLKRIAAQSN